MEFVEQVRAKLSAAQLQVLSDAVEQVDDFLLAEIVTLDHDSGPAAVARPFSDLFLPGRYVDFYDFTMLRRLYACLLVIASPGPMGASPLSRRGTGPTGRPGSRRDVLRGSDWRVDRGVRRPA